MNEDFAVIQRIIRSRRTVKTMAMNGKKIPDQEIAGLLELGDWAPNHGRTEPWRFFVLNGENLTAYGAHHAQIYWANTPEEERTEFQFDKLKHMGDNASHLIIVVMRRTPGTKIPVREEYAACCACIENILLGAEALGISAIWNTGGMSNTQAMLQYLQLAEEDLITGLIYLGYTDKEKHEAPRKIALKDKTIWI